MESSKVRIGINDTMDVLIYLDKVVRKFKAAKANDGRIDLPEIATALATTSPEALKALVGITDIPNELSDRSPAENDLIVKTALPVIFNLVGLFIENMPQMPASDEIKVTGDEIKHEAVSVKIDKQPKKGNK